MRSLEILQQILFTFRIRAQKYNIGSFVSNENGSSFYLTVRREDKVPVQIRLSNHGTYLKTWIDRTHLQNSRERLYDPSHCINISIVFIDDENDITKDCPNRKDCEDCPILPCVPQTFEGQNELGHPFNVKQFCYKSSNIRSRYINGFVKAIVETVVRGEYIDPLVNISRAAKSKTLTSGNSDNTIQEIITTERGSLTRAELKSIIRETIRDGLMEAKRRLCL